MNVVFITGAGGLLGQNLIEIFLENGFLVNATELDPSRIIFLKEKFQKNNKVKIDNLNVTDEIGIYELFNEYKKHNRVPNHFINNAAITGEFIVKSGKKFPELKDTDIENWRKVIDVNLTGPFLISKLIDNLLAENFRIHSLVNVSSMYALNSPHHEIYKNSPIKSFVAYSTSKAGLIGLTKFLAGLWGEKCRVNTICPGGIYNNQDVKLVEAISKLNMLNRMADAREIADSIFYLSSEKSSFITGETLYADGGFNSW